MHKTTQWDFVEPILVHEIPTAGPNRTVLDLAGVVEYPELEIAVDSALRLKLVTRPSLRDVHERLGGRGRPGSANLRALIEATCGARPADSGGNREVPRRRNHLTALGWTVLVITWADMTDRPAEVIRTVRKVRGD